MCAMLSTNAGAVSASALCLILHLRYFRAFEKQMMHIKCTSSLLFKIQNQIREFWVRYSYSVGSSHLVLSRFVSSHLISSRLFYNLYKTKASTVVI